MMNMTVTTLDLQTGYEVIGPVCGSCRGQTDPDQAFLEALREIRKSAAMLQADAVIGMRQTAVPLADGTGRFHIQLYGTAVREIEEVPMETGFAAAAGNGARGISGYPGDALRDPRYRQRGGRHPDGRQRTVYFQRNLEPAGG